jgi:hypothetical protein
VCAERLATQAILDAVREGRSYLAESADVTLVLIARAGSRIAGIGDTLRVRPDEEVEVTVVVGGVPWSTVRLHTADGVIDRQFVRRSGAGVVVCRMAAGSARFVRVEVRRARPLRPMVAMSNPIWLDASS